jgi:hypothetical protein
LFVNNKMHLSVGKCVSTSLVSVFHKCLWSVLVNHSNGAVSTHLHDISG